MAKMPTNVSKEDIKRHQQANFRQFKESLVETLTDDSDYEAGSEKRGTESSTVASIDPLDVTFGNHFSFVEKPDHPTEGVKLPKENVTRAEKKTERSQSLHSDLNTSLNAHSGEATSKHKDRFIYRSHRNNERDLGSEHFKTETKSSTSHGHEQPIGEERRLSKIESSGELRKLRGLEARPIAMPLNIRHSHSKIGAGRERSGEQQSLSQQYSSSGQASPGTESIVSISSNASFFKDSCKLEEHNTHLESELTAMQHRFVHSRKDNERLERKVQALCVKIANDSNLIADLNRSRSQLSRDRDHLKNRCNSLGEEVSLLQNTVEQLRVQLKCAAVDSDRTLENAINNAPQHDEKVFENLMALYCCILTRTSEMIDNKLENCDSESKVSCKQHETLKRNSFGQDNGVREQRLAIAKFREKVESLVDKVAFWSNHLTAKVWGHHGGTAGESQLEADAQARFSSGLRDGEGIDQLHGKALAENQKPTQNEAALLEQLAAFEVRVVELEAELKSAAQRIEQNGASSNRSSDQSEQRPLQEVGQDAVGETVLATASIKNAQTPQVPLRSQVDNFMFHLLLLEEELKLAHEQRQISAEKLAQCTANSKTLRMALAQKSRQLEILVEELEKTCSERATQAKITADGMGNHGKMTPMEDVAPERGVDSTVDIQDYSRITEELRFAVQEAAETKAELHRTQKKLQTCEELIQNSSTNCKELLEALHLELPLDPHPNLRELVARMTQIIRAEWISRENDLQQKDWELEQLREDNKQIAEDLKAHLETQQQSIQRFEEIASSQSEIVKRFEQKGFENQLARLRAEDAKMIRELRRKLIEAGNQLAQSQNSSETRCVELEGRLRITTEQRDALMAEFQKRVEEKSHDVAQIQQELKTLDAFTEMKQRMNSMLDEINSSQRQIYSLTRAVADRDKELRDKSRVVHKLKAELSEKSASFGEMREMFILKGQEYRELRENLRRTEQKLCSIAHQVLAGEAILGHIVEKVLPNSKTQLAIESWESLSGEIVQAVDSLVGAASRTESLEEELDVLRRHIERFAPEADLARKLPVKQIATSNHSEIALSETDGELERVRADLARTLEALKVLTSEKIMLQRTNQEIQNTHLAEIANLQRLLMETKEALTTLTAEHERLKARLIKEPTGAVSPSDLDELKRKLGILEREKLLLQLDLEEAQSRLECSRAARKGKFSELEEREGVFAYENFDISLFEQESHTVQSKLEEELARLRENLLKSQAENTQLVKSVTALKKEMEVRQAERDDLKRKLESIQSSHSENVRGAQKSSSNETLEDITGDLLKSSLRMAQDQLARTTQSFDDKRRECETLMEEVRAKTEEVESLRDEISSLRAENSKIIHWLDKMRQQFCNGVHKNNLVDYLTPERFEATPKALDETLRFVHKHIEALVSQMSPKESEGDLLRKQLQNSEISQRELREEINGLQLELQAKTTRLGELERILEISKEKLSRAASDADELEQKLGRKVNLLQKRSGNNSSSGTSVRATDTSPVETEVRPGRRCEDSRSQLRKIKSRIMQLKTALAELNHDKLSLENRCRLLEEQIEQRDGVIREMAVYVMDGENRLVVERAKARKITSICDELRAKLESIQNQLCAFESHRKFVEEIQSVLELSSVNEIVPFLEQQGSSISQLGKAVLKIRSELNGHENELGELRKSIFEQQNDLSLMLASLSKKSFL